MNSIFLGLIILIISLAIFNIVSKKVRTKDVYAVEKVYCNLKKVNEYSKKCRKVYGWRKLRIAYKINSKNIEKLSILKIPNEVKNEIRDEIAKGKIIIISEAPFQVKNWLGDKYLILDK